MVHLGKGETVKEWIYAHFNSNPKALSWYNFFVFGDTVGTLLLYFEMSIIMLEAIFSTKAAWISISYSLLLFGFIMINRYLHLAEMASAYDMANILAFILFLVYALITSPQSSNTLPLSGNPVNFILLLIQGYSVVPVVAQNMLNNLNRRDYQTAVYYLFILGGAIYTGIIVLGGYGNIVIIKLY